jgi:hypothetical protein
MSAVAGEVPARDERKRPMSRLNRRGLLTFAGAVVAVGALTGATVGPAYAARNRPSYVTYLAEGHVASNHHYKPARIILSGDSTLFLRHANWHGWSTLSATGSAQSGWNYCQPDCAAGPVKWFLAKVSLSKPRFVCGHHFFTRARFHFTHGRPKGIPQDFVYNTTPTCGSSHAAGTSLMS